jgi:Ca-activated chloride channel homolog
MINWASISFDYPWVLAGIPGLWLLWILLGRKLRNKRPGWRFPVQSSGHFWPKSNRIHFLGLPVFLRLMALTILLVALARPRGFIGTSEETREVVDIKIAIDISLSMLAQDFKPDRLEAAKELAAEFIQNRRGDRIGLVIFAGEAFTQCPLTADQVRLLRSLNQIKTGMLEDGTAIGEGLLNSVARLQQGEAVSKVVILLTDGVNNMGNVSPLDAAEAARAIGVRVYTIGVGTRGKARAPVSYDPFGNLVYGAVEVTIDEELLEKIAFITEGKYYRAENEDALRRIFAEIDELEKTRVLVTEDFTRPDKFRPLLMLAFGLLGLEWLLRSTLFKTVNG